MGIENAGCGPYSSSSSLNTGEDFDARGAASTTGEKCLCFAWPGRPCKAGASCGKHAVGSELWCDLCKVRPVPPFTKHSQC
jgi:hypothetical protein